MVATFVIYEYAMSEFHIKLYFPMEYTKLFLQRYYMNDSFYDFDYPGPIFLMIGGEGPADPRWIRKGSWIKYAKEFRALCLHLEHRYYGESHPTA